VSEAWDRAADRATERPYLDPLVAETKRRTHLSLLERWLPDLRGKSLLKTDLWEEGVAGDELLFTLAGRAGAAFGVDVSPRIVAGARERAAAAGVAVTLVRADLTRLPFETGQFDAIVSTSTLDHLPGAAEHRAALAELRRVLRDEGTLVLTVDNADNAFDWLLRIAYRMGRIPFPLHKAPSLSELERVAAEAGFRPEEHEYVVPAPRVLATAAVRAARTVRGDRGVAAVLRAFEALGQRWPRRLGSFVAVRALAR
jgi:SAM-dependent methyltransferase